MASSRQALCRLVASASRSHRSFSGNASNAHWHRTFAAAAAAGEKPTQEVIDHAPARARPDGTFRRFYKEAKAVPAPRQFGPGYVIQLDGRTLKTPARKGLVLPSEWLAHAIAAEWDYQDGGSVRPYSMPLFKLAATAIDQIVPNPAPLVETLSNFLHDDVVFVRETRLKYARKQEQLWDPLILRTQQELRVPLLVSDSILGQRQPQEAVDNLRALLNGMNHWQLASFASVATRGRSVVIALALTKGWIDVDAAVQAMRLDEDLQIADWGLVEGAHDIEIADMRATVTASSVFVRMMNHQPAR
eukprot:jgi/Mesvir1/24353/Mv11029-RA.1